MANRDKGMIIRRKLQPVYDEISKERLIYVGAPAGYGKTMAVRQWLSGDTRSAAVLTLDEYDNDTAHFCRRFCEGLAVCQPRNQTLAEIAAHSDFAGAPDEYTLRAVAALSKRKHSVLVLDDLHYLHNEMVLRLLLILLKRLPESFQIIIISRHDLPPGFSDLWVQGHLVRVAADRLCFDDEEILLLARKRGVAVTPEQAKDIHRYTGGWPIGINARLLSGEIASVRDLGYLERFIRSNIWSKWDEATREFMLNTAAARYLKPSLCAVLTGCADSEAILARLTRNGAFISQSDDGIYRYHRLFHDFLKTLLAERGDAYRQTLQEQEGQWYLDQRDFIGAAQCFADCGNPDGLGTAVEMLALTNREKFVLDILLPLLQTPVFAEAAQKRPNLFSYMVWASLAEGKNLPAEQYADCFYARFDEIEAHDPFSLHMLILLYFADYRVTLKELMVSTALFSHKHRTSNPPTSITMNMPLLHRCIRDFSEIADGDIEETVAQLRTLIGWVFNDEVGLLEKCLIAGLLYEKGQLEKAHAYAMSANAEIRVHFSSELKFCAMSTLVYTLDALGLEQEAEGTMGRIAAIIEESGAYYLNRNFNALAARRKVSRGDIQAARDWIDKSETSLYGNLHFFRIYETFADCRAYIALGDYPSAIILLEKTLEMMLAFRRRLAVIEARILLAIAYWKKKRGFQNQALEHLERAAEMACPYGFVRLFVNEGAELSGMLLRLRKRVEQYPEDTGTFACFIRMLYLKTQESPAAGLTSGQSEPPVKFTDRQMEIMRLLRQGSCYRDIAYALSISRPTLRSHLSAIYKKLDVTCGTEAIKRINALELFSE